MNLRGIKSKLIPDFPPAAGEAEAGPSLFRYDRIWRWAVIASSMVAIIPLIILAVWNFFQYQKALHAEIMFPIFNLVGNAKGSLVLFLDERKSALKFIARDNEFERLSDQARLEEVFANLRTTLGDVVDLGVITADGNQVAYIGPYQLRDVNYKNERWFKEVILRGEYISDVFLGFRDFPHIVIAIKRDTAGGGFFILRTTVDTKKFNGLVESLNLRPTSDAFLINPDGVIQTPSRYHGQVLEKIDFPVPPAGPSSEVTEVKDDHGRKVIAGYTQLENSPFTYVVVKQRQELMRNLETFLGQLIGFLALSIVVILIVIFRIATIMVQNIEEADRKRIAVLHEIEQTAKLISIGRLAAGVAHEINNPLAIINEKAGLMKDLMLAGEPTPSRDQFLKMADSILASVKRCSTITYRLLGFARHIDVQIESIELAALMDEVLSFLAKEAEYRSITVKLDIAPDVPPLQSDRGQLQQVFLNIINNAFGNQINYANSNN